MKSLPADYFKYRILSLIIALIAPLLSFAQQKKQSPETTYWSSVEKSFQTPPDSVKPWMYWYWISDNISRKGITRDLETMKKLGIGEAFIGNIGLSEVPYGKVPVLSEEWWKLTEHAVHEGARLGVNIGIFNSPGWSQSGGPWIKPDESMRYLVTSQLKVKGPLKYNHLLSLPGENFQEVALLAFPAPAEEINNITSHAPVINCLPEPEHAIAMIDGDTATACLFEHDQKAYPAITITINLKKPLTARSLVLYPAKLPFIAHCELQVKEKDQFKTICSFVLDRSNPSLNVGPMPYAPEAAAFSPVTGATFRLILTNIQNKAGLAEIQLSASPVLDHYIEKQLGKMHQTPHPMWDAYEWPEQPALKQAGLAVDPSKILNITQYLSREGVLKWNVPQGDWIILRVGMIPTGVKNSPAPPEATGLEVDKMNKKALKAHFNAFMGKILEHIPQQDRKALKHVVADSYEVGSENWTDGFGADFQQKYGYDPKPWLPVLTGRIVGSPDQSNRFLWDMRRLIADRIAYEYVGGLRELSEQKGLRNWLENYGHWGFPAEFLQYGGQSDDVSGEFWAEGDLGSIELKDASSAAHIYGKNQVWAESFTAGGLAFKRYPGLLKKRGDWSFTEGINHTLLHVCIEQPYDSLPGVNAGFGTEFNHNNTWFPQAKCWIDYLRRCNFLLQQGKPVADVCYFIGEDVPKMTGIRNPELPEGYSYDYINGEVIRKRLSVRNGKLVLPDGVSYRLLVLPPQQTMRPDLLKKIKELVAAGAVILGNPPTHSPSLQHYPACDKEVQAVAAALWQNCDGETVKAVKYGKGWVLRGMSLQEAFQHLGIVPDFSLAEKQPVLFTHRAATKEDIYFITNQSDSTLHIHPAFRVSGSQPELWDAVTGERRLLPQFQEENGRTVIPLKLAPSQSWFIVFRKNALVKNDRIPGESNFPEEKRLMTLTGPWKVVFDSSMRGPLQPVIFNKLDSWSVNPEDSIRFYSGTAGYHKIFHLDKMPEGKRLILNLGKVSVMARVIVNGRDLGGIWTDPWQADITDAVKPGDNELEVKVVNLWVNRLIGDSRFPENERKTWSPIAPYKPDDPLEPSGLLGPVTIGTEK